MTEHLVIRLAAGGTAIVTADVVSAEGKWQRSIAVSDIGASSYASVSAVSNGVDVSLFRQELPALSDAKIRKIIPSVMADQLGQGAGDQHFAIWPTSDAGKLVAVASDAYMQAVQNTMSNAGLTATALVPDYCLLETKEEPQAVIGSDGYCRAKLGDGTGFTVEADMAEAMLKDIHSHSLTIEEERAMYASVVGASENLLQGSYATGAGLSNIFLVFRRAAFLFAAMCILWMAAIYSDISNKEAAADQLYSEAENLFRQAFPDVRRIVNVEVQARQQINRLQAGSTPAFLALSGALFKAVDEVDAALLEAIRFDAERGELVATLSFSSFAEGERLKNLLAQEQVRLSEGGSRQENGRIFTDITLRSGQ